MKYVRSIPVADASGGAFTVYEFKERRFLWKVRRYRLCTGEVVEFVKPDTFRIAGTGDAFTAARPVKKLKNLWRGSRRS